jgi:hypothetical protein
MQLQSFGSGMILAVKVVILVCGNSIITPSFFKKYAEDTF